MNTIERQALPDPLAVEPPPLKRHSAAVVNRAYTQDATPVGPAENVLNILLEASGHVMTATGQELQRKMEEDKTVQTLRFYEGMAPSDDATQAGYRAHALLNMQNKVLEETAALRKQAETFTGDDEEWSETVRTSQRQTYDNLLSEYPHLSNDKDAHKAIGALYGEQVPQIALARVGAKLTQEHDQRVTTLEDNLRVRLDGLSPSEQYDVLNTAMDDAADAMQLSKQVREKVLMNLAIDRARLGDLTVMDFTKVYKGGALTSLFERSGELQAAEVAGKKEYLRLNSQQMDMDKTDLLQRLGAGSMTMEAFFTEAEKQNQKYMHMAWQGDSRVNSWLASQKDKPWEQQAATATAMSNLVDALKGRGTSTADRDAFFKRAQEQNAQFKTMVWTDDAMRSAWDAHAKGVAETATLHTLLAQGMTIRQGEGSQPLGLTIGDAETRNDLVDGYVQMWEGAAARDIAALPKGSTPEQAAAIRRRYTLDLAQHLAAHQLENKDWTNRIAVLATLDMENAETMKALPQAARDALSLYDSLPPGSQLMHTKDEKVRQIVENFRYFQLQGQTEVQALASAQKAVRNPRKFNDGEVKAIYKAADSVADKKSSGGWLPGTPDSAPAWYKELHRQEVRKMTLANFLAGAATPELAAAQAAKAFDTRYTQLKNGELVYGNRPTLAALMKVHPEDIELVMDTYKNMNKQHLEDMAGHSVGDMYFEVQPGRNTFVVRSGLNGMFLTQPTPLEEMKKGAQGFISSNQPLYKDKAWSWGKELTGFIFGKDADASIKLRQPENYQEHQDRIVRTLAMVENEDRVGYNPKHNSYQPYQDSDKGGYAIGYGHRLTPKEMKQGYLMFNGIPYGFGGAAGGKASMISEDVARAILKEDIAKAQKGLAKSWKGYDELPDKYKGVLVNLYYNTGSVLPSNWPKLREAMMNNDDRAVRKEMVTYYTNKQTGERVTLAGRSKFIADRFGLKQ